MSRPGLRRGVLHEYRCCECGYGIRLRIPPDHCPMCRGSTWQWCDGDRGRSGGARRDDPSIPPEADPPEPARIPEPWPPPDEADRPDPAPRPPERPKQTPDEPAEDAEAPILMASSF